MWLSVPPETRRKPRLVSASASARAFADDALLVRHELGRRRLGERHGLRRDDVLERPALDAGEDVAVEVLRPVGAAEDEAAARAPQRLVGRRRHERRVGHGRGVQPGDHEAGDVRDVAHEHRADLVGHGSESREVDLARVRRRARDDELRTVLARQRGQRLVVDAFVLAPHAVGDDLVLAAREGERMAVGEMASVREVHAEDLVALLEGRHVDGHVGLRARVRLDVGVLGREEGLRAVDREPLDLVDELASSVVALARVALGVLVGQDRALRFAHGPGDPVLRRDQLDALVLPAALGRDPARDLGIDDLEVPVEQGGGGENGRHRAPFADSALRLLEHELAVFGVAVAVGHPGDVIGDRAIERTADGGISRRPRARSGRAASPAETAFRAPPPGRGARRPAAGAGCPDTPRRSRPGRGGRGRRAGTPGRNG